jgi:hypothetical protein
MIKVLEPGATKIYFAASIKAGRDLAPQYSSIVEILKGYGSVLSEHVGSTSLGKEGERLDPSFIHSRDLALIREAELVVAEVTVPSLGVGYEIRYSIEQSKRIICLCHMEKQSQLSAMISGAPEIQTIFYSDISDLQKKLFLLKDYHLQVPENASVSVPSPINT